MLVMNPTIKKDTPEEYVPGINIHTQIYIYMGIHTHIYTHLHAYIS